MNTKILTKCLLGAALVGTSIANAGFFEYKEDSKLSKMQQNTLKIFFVEKSVQGISSLVSTFETGILKDIVQKYKEALLKGDASSWDDIIASYLLEPSRKEKDLKAILRYSADLTSGFEDAEKIFQDAITKENDGFFNGIIRETLKSYKKCLTDDEIGDEEQLTEAYEVLWDTVVSAWNCDFSSDIWDKIAERYPEAKLGNLLTLLREADGRNTCEKIAYLLGSAIDAQMEKANGCCGGCGPCCKKTYDITRKAVADIIQVLPTIVQLVVTIISAVK